MFPNLEDFSIQNENGEIFSFSLAKNTFSFINDRETKFIVSEVFLHSDYYDYCLDKLGDIVVIDIGANKGVTSVFFAKMKNVSKVYSIEPVAFNINIFNKNIALNGVVDKVELLEFGLAALDSEMDITFDSHRSGRARTSGNMEEFVEYINPITERVKLRKSRDIIESIISKHPSSPIVIKIDCEGAEDEILYDITDSLYSKIVYIVGEYHIPPKPIYDFLSSKKFTTHIFSTPLAQFPNYGKFKAIK